MKAGSQITEGKLVILHQYHLIFRVTTCSMVTKLGKCGHLISLGVWGF